MGDRIGRGRWAWTLSLATALVPAHRIPAGMPFHEQDDATR